MICNPSYKKVRPIKTGDLQSPLSETIYIFLFAKNLHNPKNNRIFAAKDRNRRNDYGKQ